MSPQASPPDSPPSPPGPFLPPSSPAAAAPLPGFAPPPDPPPGPRSPDPLPGQDDGSASSARPAPIPASFKGKSSAYAAIAKGLLIAVGGLMNRFAAGEDDDNLAFLPDDDDTATIPPPLGRLAARRIPLGDGTENLSDLEDIGMAAVGVLAWLAKGATEYIQRRRALRRLVRGVAVGEGEPVAQDAATA